MLCNSYVLLCFTCELLFCSSPVLGKGMSSAPPIPAAQGAIIVAVLGQFAALQDQPDRKDQRSLGFASPGAVIALVGATGQTWLLQGLLLGLEGGIHLSTAQQASNW